MSIDHVASAITEWAARRKIYNIYQAYWEGRHQLKFVSPDWQQKYAQQVLTGAVLSIRENLCPAVVTGFTDDIHVKSWGTSGDNADSDAEGLSRLLGYLKRESWKCGDAFVLVWPDKTGAVRPVFHRASQMAPHADPDNPAVLDWCAKIWTDGSSKRGRVNIYYPDRVERWETRDTLSGDTQASATLPEQPNAWRPCTDSEGPVIGHHIGAVPVCWLKLDADEPSSHGMSILNDIIPLQDGLNSSLANLLVNQEAHSRPFWYLLNYEPSESPQNPYLRPADPAPQQPVRQRSFDRTRQSIITHNGPGPFGQLDPPDVTRLLEVQDAFKAKVCSVVGLPPYLMQGDIGNVPSGASLRRLERRCASRIRSWQADNTPVLRGLKQLLGMGSGPIEWEPMENLDEMERWQVAEIKHSLGVSLEDVLTGVGEADVDGVVGRATDTAAAMGQAFLNGQGVSSYGG